MQTDSLTNDFSAAVEAITAQKMRFKLELGLGAVVMIIIYFWMINAKFDGFTFYVIPALGLCGLYVLQMKRYKKHSADQIMPLLCGAIDGLRYNGLQTPSLSHHEKTMLLPKGHFSGEGISISGSFGDQRFRQSNIILQERRGKSTVTTFQGVLLALPALGIEPTLLVRPSDQGRGAISTWIFGSDDPMPAQAPLGRLSSFGEHLTLFAPDDSALAEFAPKLKSLIKQSDAVFTDSATIDAVLTTQSSTLIAIADGSLPFAIGGIFQSKAALAHDIERASGELSLPIKLMQLWSQGLSGIAYELN